MTLSETASIEISEQSSLVVRPNLDGPGAEILGADLPTLKPGRKLDSLKQALLRHGVIYLRNQNITNADILSFASHMGNIEHHLNYKADGSELPSIHDVTNLDATGKPSESPINNENYYWHSDKSYRQRPALVTLLHAVEVPPSGGDTEFADMTAAYAELPALTKQKIDMLKVVHSWRHMRATISNRSLTDEEAREFPDVIHPLVRIHPETGARSLYLGMYCSSVIGLPDVEGEQLLRSLLEHATQTKFVYAHKWRPLDLIIWDNRCLMHRAVPNYELGQHRRILRRVVVQGDAPLASTTNLPLRTSI